MIRAEVLGGVCGLVTMVEADSPDGMNVELHIESACPQVQAMAAELIGLDAFEEILRRPLAETTLARLAAKYKLHTSCLVPVGLLKVVEAAAGLALPSESWVKLTYGSV